MINLKVELKPIYGLGAMLKNLQKSFCYIEATRRAAKLCVQYIERTVSVGLPHPEMRIQDELLVRGSRTKPQTSLSKETGLRRPWGEQQDPGCRPHRRPGKTVTNSAITNLRHGRKPQGHSLPQSRAIRGGRSKGGRGHQATKELMRRQDQGNHLNRLLARGYG